MASVHGSSSSSIRNGAGRAPEAGDLGIESPYLLQGYDHPGMVLVSDSLTGSNYLSWSRAMMIALGAKTKIGFIDGRCIKPDSADPNLDRWIKVDYMVTSWILNSISKDIVEAFLYTTSSFDLWNELKERFGECNGPLLYQLKRDIASISQGDLSLSQYYTKLKKLWDELSCLVPLPVCECGASAALAVLECNDRLMQFLMGLNDMYDHIRNQILVMDPLPSINKTYSMVLRVEKQKEVHVSYSPMIDTTMMMKITNEFRWFNQCS
ncbi:hypothetical protein Syun_014798 [Stephania yunnanensis]|uniref:Retrotransposon Copia-like N-terminal domain-containing protein n=1 Tax=Stephania yunnanensis TaxID=152371 RepID=A0AAP0JLR2_9MAGN